MTLADLLRRVTDQMREDALESEDVRLAVGYLNEAMEDLLSLYLPYKTCDVMFPSDGSLPKEAWPGDAERIMAVEQNGQGLPFDLRDGALLSPAAAGCKARLRYRWRIAPLTDESDTPSLPERYHGALCDYATYRLLCLDGSARRKRGEEFFSRYLQKRATVSAQSPLARERLVRKYG